MVTSEFISDCISGREEAIQTLIRTYQRSVFQLALSILDRTHAPLDEAIDQAEKATHETFVTALDRIGHYREDTPFNVWLNRITIQVCRKRFRVWQRQRKLSSAWSHMAGVARRSDSRAPSPTASSESWPPRSETEEALWQTVRGLDDRLRLPVILRYFHELPVKEIAATLRLSEGAVHARLDRAREIIFQTSGGKH